ncbi:MAG: hypothetical protein AVDCRST_MAG85-1843, partial [uncultured Solirubrobacteraceae bacterium]
AARWIGGRRGALPRGDRCARRGPRADRAGRPRAEGRRDAGACAVRDRLPAGPRRRDGHVRGRRAAAAAGDPAGRRRRAPGRDPAGAAGTAAVGGA